MTNSIWHDKQLARLIIPEPNSGCWLWLGTIANNGYGIAWSKQLKHKLTKPRQKMELAHRYIFQPERGVRIPDGMHLDHLCSIKSCLNPDHLEIVTPKQNTHRWWTKHLTTPPQHQTNFTPLNTELHQKKQAATSLIDRTNTGRPRPTGTPAHSQQTTNN